MFPSAGSSKAYSDHVMNHEMPMFNAGIHREEIAEVTRMRLAQDGEWVRFYFRSNANLEKLLGVDYGKLSEGPQRAAANATASFLRRFPQHKGNFTLCHE